MHRFFIALLVQLNFALHETSTAAYKEGNKLTSSQLWSTANHGIWPLDFNNKNRLKIYSKITI
jgi:hypothetical protein